MLAVLAPVPMSWHPSRQFATMSVISDVSQRLGASVTDPSAAHACIEAFAAHMSSRCVKALQNTPGSTTCGSRITYTETCISLASNIESWLP